MSLVKSLLGREPYRFGEADDELKKVMDWLEFESQPQPVRGPQR